MHGADWACTCAGEVHCRQAWRWCGRQCCVAGTPHYRVTFTPNTRISFSYW